MFDRYSQGYLSERDIYQPTRLQPAMKHGILTLPAACVQLTYAKLCRFWTKEYLRHTTERVNTHGYVLFSTNTTP
jgi:hypothetical protein